MHHFRPFLLAAALLLGSVVPSRGEGICARVRIEIVQRLSFERQAFEAKMVITNGADAVLTEANVTLNFADDAGATVIGTPDPAATGAAFFFRMTGTTVLPGTIPAGQSSTYTWQIIPAAATGGSTPTGRVYYIGALLRYRINGQLQEVNVAPDYVVVLPMPRLRLDYFIAELVQSDEPFTPAIEPPVPFTLGVRVSNVGFGTARNLQLETGQPVIVDNQLGLAIDFAYVSCEVNGQPAPVTLIANFGNLDPQGVGMARWQMTTSISGRFEEFTASFTHANELGGVVTSLLDPPTTHLLIHDVLADAPGKDAVRDFLARDVDVVRLYESDGTDSLVGVAAFAQLGSLGGNRYSLQLGALSNAAGNLPNPPAAAYAALADPSAGTLVVASALRSDGKVLPAANLWQTRRWDNGRFNYQLHVFDSQPIDARNGQPYTYVLSLGAPANINHAPALGAIGDRQVIEGQTISFVVNASDPDAQAAPVLSVEALDVGPPTDLPSIGPGRANYSWTPALGAGLAGRGFRLRFVATDSLDANLQTSRVIRIQVLNGQSYQRWKDLYFPGITDPLIVGDGADPDHDGFSNLVEYGLGSDPTVPGAPEMTFGIDVVGARRFMTLTYRRRLNDPGLRFNVLSSSEPDGGWRIQSRETTRVPIDAEFERVTVRDQVDLNVAPRRYMKVQVTRANP